MQFFNMAQNVYYSQTGQIRLCRDKIKKTGKKWWNRMVPLTVTSPDFTDKGYLSREHTGFGRDFSPAFELHGLHQDTVSIAVLMVDLDVPFYKEYPHWLLWNLPPRPLIPANIPHGPLVLDGAVQGIAYGKHCYRGPKPPFFEWRAHRYVFRFCALDCRLTLPSSAKYRDLLRAMQGHILQDGCITGLYRR